MVPSPLWSSSTAIFTAVLRLPSRNADPSSNFFRPARPKSTISPLCCRSSIEIGDTIGARRVKVPRFLRRNGGGREDFRISISLWLASRKKEHLLKKDTPRPSFAHGRFLSRGEDHSVHRGHLIANRSDLALPHKLNDRLNVWPRHGMLKSVSSAISPSTLLKIPMGRCNVSTVQKTVLLCNDSRSFGPCAIVKSLN